jgi:hypothetical protein
MKMRIFEEKILKMIRSNEEFIKEDKGEKEEVLLMKMRINEEKILLMIYLWSLIIMLANSSLESFPSPSWSHLSHSFLQIR